MTPNSRRFIQAQLSVGPKEFTRGVKETCHSVEEVLAAVCEVFEISKASLRERHRHPTRGVAAWALVRDAGLTQRDTAAVLGMGTGAAVSQQLTNWRRTLAADPKWEAAKTELARRLAPARRVKAAGPGERYTQRR